MCTAVCLVPEHKMAETPLRARPVSPGGMPDRPLSPHLTIFRPLVTMMMSIVHRMSGAAVYFCMNVIAWSLLAAGRGAGAVETASDVFVSWSGRLVHFGFAWALLHRLLGGIRHLIWDVGHG